MKAGPFAALTAGGCRAPLMIEGGVACGQLYQNDPPAMKAGHFAALTAGGCRAP